MIANIYYDPEKFGLTVVAEVEYSSGGYEFNTRVVWRQKETRKLLTARDSGCSCPVPFEDINLSNVEPVDFAALRREVMEHVSTSENYHCLTAADAQKFLAKVRRALAR